MYYGKQNIGGGFVEMVYTEQNKGELNHYKAQAITAAKDLGYGKTVIEKIRAAENDRQITNIMKSARTSRR